MSGHPDTVGHPRVALPSLAEWAQEGSAGVPRNALQTVAMPRNALHSEAPLETWEQSAYNHHLDTLTVWEHPMLDSPVALPGWFINMEGARKTLADFGWTQRPPEPIRLDIEMPTPADFATNQVRFTIKEQQ